MHPKFGKPPEKQRRAFVSPMPAKTNAPKVYSALTERELHWFKRLHHVTFGVGSPDKSFVWGFPETGTPQMTYRQRAYLHRLVYHYRHQLELSDDVAKTIFDALEREAETPQ